MNGPALAAPPRVERCADWQAGTRTGKRWPTVDELMAVLGNTTSSPAFVTLTALFGDPTRVMLDGEERLAFVDAGLALHVLHMHRGDVVDRIDVLGRIGDGSPGAWGNYGGPVPHGVSFAHDVDALQSALGPADKPATCAHGPFCDYDARALRAHLQWIAGDQACVERVTIAQPLAPEQLIVDDFWYEAGEQDGVHGVVLHVRPRFASMYPARNITMTARLATHDGAPVQEAAWRMDDGSTPRRDRALERTAYLGTFAPSRDVDVFVPYVAIDLPAGTHQLAVELSAISRERGRIGKGDGPPTAMTVASVASVAPYAIDLVMPRVRTVRFGVRRVEVKRGQYDDIEAGYAALAIATLGATALFVPPTKWKLPDPQWIVYVGGELVYRSSARQDVLRASWTASTPWIRLAPDDRLELVIEDEDTSPRGDVLAKFLLGADELTAQAKTPALSAEHVTRLVIGGVAVRE
jgi:hypothetical protein